MRVSKGETSILNEKLKSVGAHYGEDGEIFLCAATEADENITIYFGKPETETLIKLGFNLGAAIKSSHLPF